MELMPRNNCCHFESGIEVKTFCTADAEAFGLANDIGRGIGG